MGQSGTRWRRETAHDNCPQCRRAAEEAKSEAIILGSTKYTWTEGSHSATVSRSTTRGK